MIEMAVLRIMILPLLIFLCNIGPLSDSLTLTSRARSQSKPAEAERNRNYLRQEFQKNFKNLQEIGKKLLEEHEAARLTPARLGRDAKSIQKCAKALRTFLALGEMAQPTEVKKEINTSR